VSFGIELCAATALDILKAVVQDIGPSPYVELTPQPKVGGASSRDLASVRFPGTESSQSSWQTSVDIDASAFPRLDRIPTARGEPDHAQV
jgi:hypothetical protein